jgi:hypothetical protein
VDQVVSDAERDVGVVANPGGAQQQGREHGQRNA